MFLLPVMEQEIKKIAPPTPSGDLDLDLRWTPEEDQQLRVALLHLGSRDWQAIASWLPFRSAVACHARWLTLQQSRWISKRAWSAQEDALLYKLVAFYGPHKWAFVASHFPGRSNKQCRERWCNHLNPAIDRSPWTPEETALILELRQKCGNRWVEIARRLPGRTDHAVRNYWYFTLYPKMKMASHRSSDNEIGGGRGGCVGGLEGGGIPKLEEDEPQEEQQQQVQSVVAVDEWTKQVLEDAELANQVIQDLLSEEEEQAMLVELDSML